MPVYPYGNYNYFPATYQPYQQSYYNPQMTQQMPQNQPVQQTAPTQANNAPSSIIWINGINEAATYPVAPNNAVALWDSSAPTIYLKQADPSGKPTIKIFDLVERTQTPAETQKKEEAKLHDYATKNDLDGLKMAVEGEIGLLRERIEKMSHAKRNKEDDE